MTSADLQLKGIAKVFGVTTAVDQLDLSINAGEFFAILGPSGCGKTTTLRMIAGLEDPTAGNILIGGKNVTRLPTHHRNIGMVFQSYALFPHMTVFDNIAFGLRMRDWPGSRIRSRVRELLEVIQLPDVGGRFASQLSGGQQQRIALARALAPEPAVLLLDEPLSNLDLKLRQGMRLEIRRIQRELGITTVFVTHDQGEALSLADRIMVLRDGRVSQIGAPADVYQNPVDQWVASFLGDANIISGTTRQGEAEVKLEGVQAAVTVPALADTDGPVALAMRPENIQLYAANDAPANPDGFDWLTGTITNFAYVGYGTRYVVDLDGTPISELLVDAATAGAPWREGSAVSVGLPRDKWIVLG